MTGKKLFFLLFHWQFSFSLSLSLSGYSQCFLIFDRVGIEIPKLEVRYEHLKVEAEAYIGSRALTSFFKFFINKLEVTVDFFFYRFLLTCMKKGLFLSVLTWLLLVLKSILHCLHLLSSRKKQLSTLRDVSGTIRPCRWEAMPFSLLPSFKFGFWFIIHLFIYYMQNDIAVGSSKFWKDYTFVSIGRKLNRDLKVKVLNSSLRFKLYVLVY